MTRSELSHRVFRLTAAPLGDLAGRGSIVALVEDVTEQRTMEAQLIHSDKMATIGHLVSGVAHELNNPLTSIAGLTELLLERGPLPDFPREHLRIIQDQAERASGRREVGDGDPPTATRPVPALPRELPDVREQLPVGRRQAHRPLARAHSGR